MNTAMRTGTCALVALGALAVSHAQPVMYRPGQELRSLSTDVYTVSVQKNGRVDLVLSNRIELFSNVRPMVWFDGEDKPAELHVEGKRSFRQEIATALGQGQGMVLDAKDGQWIIQAYPGKPFLVAQVVFTNAKKKPVRVRSLHPWHLSGDVDGAVGFDGAPTDVLVLTPWPMDGDAPAVEPEGAGYSVIAATNDSTGVTLVSGFLNYENARGEFRLGQHDESYDTFQADYVFDEPVEVAPGALLVSAPLYIAVSETNPMVGLERFAVAMSRVMDRDGGWLPEVSPSPNATLIGAPDTGKYVGTLTDLPGDGVPLLPFLTAARRYFVAPWLGVPLMPPVSMAESSPMPKAMRRSLLIEFALLGGTVQVTDVSARDEVFLNAIADRLSRPARPIDLFREHGPRVFVLPLEGALGDVTVLAVFNWREEPPAAVPLEALGLIPGQYYAVYDIWGDKVVGSAIDSLTINAKYGEVSLFALRQRLGRPALLGDAQSITMGCNWIREANWDPQTRVLEGNVLARERPYHLRVLVPEGFASQSVEVAGAEAPFTSDGQVVGFSVASPATATAWRIQF